MPLRPAFHTPLLRLVRCLALALAVSSCGTMAYNSDWEEFDATGEPGGMVGRWEGEWRSEWNEHEGSLRCMMTRAADDTYLARFHSTYGWFFFFRHETLFLVTDDTEGILRFEGEEDLGSLVGGVYRYHGTIQGDRFEAHYSAENGDHGIFSMQRVN